MYVVGTVVIQSNFCLDISVFEMCIPFVGRYLNLILFGTATLCDALSHRPHKTAVSNNATCNSATYCRLAHVHVSLLLYGTLRSSSKEREGKAFEAGRRRISMIVLGHHCTVMWDK